jgi:DNA repair exonuclease SbcCD ATPase subunit
MKIAHISDIHWRGLTRHSEYTRAFNILFDKLRAINPDLIFLGGDYFHTKTSGISPEVIDRLAWMFKTMGDIAPVHAILGNHDGNLANEDRQDAISPIISAMDHDRIHLYKNSGEIDLGKQGMTTVNLCVFSCFDKPGWETVKPIPGDINIAAFHGSVGGTQMDNGWIMPDAKAEVKLDMFQGYDFVFLGDIHKRQFLAQRPDKNGVLKPWIGYPGSTIQQNFGEDEVKGFLVWDIRAKDDWDVEFVEVQNLQPFITFPWQDSIENTLNALQSSRKLLDGSRYRLASKMPLNPLLGRQMSHVLKAAHGAGEVVFKAERSFEYDMINHGNIAVKKTGLRNNKEVMHGFYREFLDSNSKKFLVSDAQIEEGCNAIDVYLDRFNASEIETARDVSWTIKEFEFDNLFRYGEGNKIDFGNLDGVVGLFGKNKVGKSSLVGALMYVLFNGSDRDGITKNGQIMNQNKKTCEARIVLTVNGVDYRIERSSQRVALPKKGKKAKTEEEFDGDKTETKLVFTRLNSDGTETSLNGTTREETDKAIRKLLGNSQDFLMTSVATQSKMERFIDEGASSRKTILNRFLDLDIFEKLYLYAKEDVAGLNAKVSTLSDSWRVSWNKTDEELLAPIKINEEELGILETKVANTREQLDALRLWIAQNESVDAVEATNNLLKVQQKLFSLKRQLSKAEQDQASLTQAIVDIQTEVERLQIEASVFDIKALQAGIDKIREIENKLSSGTFSLKEQQRILEGQEKSVRKLTLVPCGDQFPNCLYIKDSHDDRKTIEAKRAEVERLSKSLVEVSSELKRYQEERFAEKLNRHFIVQQNIKELLKEKTEKEAQLVLIGKSCSDVNKWLTLARQEEAKLIELATNQDDISLLETKKKELRTLQDLTLTQERRRTELLIQIGREKAMIEQIAKDRAEAGSMLNKIKVFESVQAAFHKNGIPAIVLKTQLPAINTELAKLLGGLVDFNITFDTEPGSNTMDIWIEDGHSKRVLELGSGMEKMLASIAIRVALTNLSSLPKSDLLIIDEGFNALDEEHVGKCLELLQTLKGYFKTVLVISHMQRVKEAADIIVEVSSNGVDSRIEA